MKIAGTPTQFAWQIAKVYDAGWQTTKKKFSALFPGKMIGGDVFVNSSAKLPYAPGRIWYEADINYVS